MTNPDNTASEKPVKPSDASVAKVVHSRAALFADDVGSFPHDLWNAVIDEARELDASAPASGLDEVDRYELGPYYARMEKRTDGEWVRYDDHASTLRERDRTINRLTAQVAELRAELAARPKMRDISRKDAERAASVYEYYRGSTLPTDLMLSALQSIGAKVPEVPK